jgi:hypothetical protein
MGNTEVLVLPVRKLSELGKGEILVQIPWTLTPFFLFP